MQALPGSAFKGIETEFFVQLLMSLLANPSCLDGCRQGAQVGLRRQVGEIVFFLPPTHGVRRRAKPLPRAKPGIGYPKRWEDPGTLQRRLDARERKIDTGSGRKN